MTNKNKNRSCPTCGREAHTEGSSVTGCRRFMAEFLYGNCSKASLVAECEAASKGGGDKPNRRSHARDS